jgi:hypothetical protein
MRHLLYALLATARSSLRSRRGLALENLALDKDAPEPRERESADGGNAIALPMVGGLHHRYTRISA